MSFSRLLLASLIAFGLATYALGAAVLPDDEVKALRDIAKTLGKTDWNFSADPCGGQWGWANPKAEDGSENAVSCNCIFSNGTICHVTSITSCGIIHAEEGSSEIQRQLNFGNRVVEVGITRNSPIQCVSSFAEEISSFAADLDPILAKFHRFGPEIVIFAILGKFRFCNYF